MSKLKHIILEVSIRPHEYGEPGFFAVTPGLQGCHASGETLEEALSRIKEVAMMTLEFRKKNNYPDTPSTPDPESLECWLAVEAP